VKRRLAESLVFTGLIILCVELVFTLAELFN
jgi:hypothetical protein